MGNLWSYVRRAWIKLEIAGVKVRLGLQNVDAERRSAGGGEQAGPSYDRAAQLNQGQAQERIDQLHAKLRDLNSSRE